MTQHDDPQASSCVPPSADPHASDLAAARGGDRAATRRLLQAVGPAVVGVVGAVLGRGDRDVEDVVQEALVGVVSAIATFRGESSFLHFARSIGLRRALDHRRSRARRGTPVELDDTHEAQEPSPQEGAVAARRREAFRGLLEALPEAQAEAFAQRVLLGSSIEEIAAEAGAPVETIRSRLRLAKAALRARITDDPTLLELSETDDDEA
ncbi:MAG: RNA polymerase sigma factor [Deltaproteobacteria bacterium]|nr:RNA polymerase sigma factor [Deltaproteobacteria bacterium]